MMRRILVYLLAALMAASPILSFAETEIRLIGGPGENNAGDMYLGASGYTDSAGGRRIYAINLNTFGFPQDNAIKGGNNNLYGLSYGVVPAWRMSYFGTSGAVGTLALGAAGHCLKSTGASSAPSWGECGSSSGTDNADEITSGFLGTAYGGWGESIATSTGVPYFDNGSLSWNTLTQFLALVGVTYNSTDNSWSYSGAVTTLGESVAASFASTCNPLDNECYLNITNSGEMTGNISAGNLYLDNSVDQFKYRNNDNTANYSLVAWVPAPANAGSACKAGMAAKASGFLYICVATNTWQRVVIATWP